MHHHQSKNVTLPNTNRHCAQYMASIATFQTGMFIGMAIVLQFPIMIEVREMEQKLGTAEPRKVISGCENSIQLPLFS